MQLVIMDEEEKEEGKETAIDQKQSESKLLMAKNRKDYVKKNGCSNIFLNVEIANYFCGPCCWCTANLLLCENMVHMLFEIYLPIKEDIIM